MCSVTNELTVTAYKAKALTFGNTSALLFNVTHSEILKLVSEYVIFALS